MVASGWGFWALCWGACWSGRWCSLPSQPCAIRGTRTAISLPLSPCLALYPLVFTTLALCFSTFSAFPLAAGLSVMAAGIGWAEGLLRFLERTFAIQALGVLASGASYAMPIGRMARWTTKLLGPFPTLEGKTITLASPFPGQQALPIDFAFILGYVVLIFLIGALVFGRRDL